MSLVPLPFPSLTLPPPFSPHREHAALKGQYTPQFFVPGDLCMAVFSEDEMWYRARVEAVKEVPVGNTQS